MKRIFYLSLSMVCLMQLLSCKKDSQPALQSQTSKSGNLAKGLLSFSANGQLVDAVIDTTNQIILVTVPNAADLKSITINFTLANKVIAFVNNNPVTSGAVLNLGNAVNFTLKSGNNSQSLSFQLSAQDEMGYFGLFGAIAAQKSLSHSYNFYYDQFDGSIFQSINCGPASTTMAIKWADSTFTKTPAEARAEISSTGGWWQTGDVSAYLTSNGISNVTDTISNLDTLVKTSIDNNKALILCLDMYYVARSGNSYQHTQKFYDTDAPGWGHFILIKGYVQAGKEFYLDAYDPYSDGLRYTTVTPGQLKGQDRYYLDFDIKTATNIWWPYAIILAPKGTKITASTHLQLNGLGKPKKAIPVGYGR